MNNLCMLPFMALEARPNGDAAPCCLYNGSVGNFNDNSFENIWHSDQMMTLRYQFMNGERPAGCQKCWTVEDSGGESKRQVSDRTFNFTPTTIVPKAPMYYDLKLGTVCNLTCVTCSSASSFKWMEDEEKIYGKPFHNFKSFWIDENSSFWKHIEKNLKDVKAFDFSGGEPFLIKKHFDILEKCVHEGVAKNIRLHYNTNGTVTPTQKMLDIWQEFGYVDIMFSIDGIKEKFEYMRYPAKWNDWITNFNIVRNYKSLNVGLCYTVSIFNFYDTPEFIQWCKDENISNQPYLNLLHYPEWCSIQAIPPDLYPMYIDKLKGDEYVPLLNTMQARYNGMYQEFLEKSSAIDKVRNNSYTNIFKDVPKWR